MTDMLFYDGSCGLSHHVVSFLVRADKSGDKFCFAPVQGEAFRTSIPGERRQRLPDSMVVQTFDGNLLTYSDAWIYVLRKIAGPWRAVAAIMALVPRPMRDLIYRLVARTRYWFFGKRDNLYPAIAPEEQSRFR